MILRLLTDGRTGVPEIDSLREKIHLWFIPAGRSAFGLAKQPENRSHSAFQLSIIFV